MSSFAKQLFSMDPERAVQWATTISDPESRAHRVDKLVAQWRTQDGAAAKAWLEKRE
ncbi:MAG: hypothetical protein ACKVHP_18190 [Verrucomicrobiales bacterium]